MKERISATIDKDLSDWINQQVRTKTFRNRSHVIEVALIKLKEGSA